MCERPFFRAFLRGLCALAVLLLAVPAQAQRQAPEPELKAAILVNLLLFVDWRNPGAQPQDRLSACYLEPGPVARALVQFEGKLLRGKPLRVMRINQAQVEGCHLLYLSPVESASLPDLVPAVSSKGVLLAGDTPGYLQRGVMLNLDIEGGRVVFDVNLRAVRQAGLAVSSKVLRLARTVQGD